MINMVHPGTVKEVKEENLRSYEGKREREFKEHTVTPLQKPGS